MAHKLAVTFCTVAILLAFIHHNAAAQNSKLKLRWSGLSDRDLLELGEPRERIGDPLNVSMNSVSDPDTIRILAIRVEFLEDNSNLTTGNGTFDLSTPEDVILDPPPHNRTYFEHQLLALAHYYQTVSNGKLVLESEVYPRQPSRAYAVSQEMSFYSPIDSEELLDQRLAELFQEAFQSADQGDDINFSEFDAFMLFHAGVGRDFAFDFDATPQDIPSVFLNFRTLRKQLGNEDPTYPGIAVNAERYFIRDGIILPETQSQDGIEIGLLGTMAIMLGNQLGLPILFNPDTGNSGIGVFGLMDQGSGNFFGLLPAQPSAWSKIFLGWENAIDIRNGADLEISVSQSSNPNKIYKIPIDSQEYFLLENRTRDRNDDQIAIGSDANGTRVEFKWDEQGQRIIADERVGVITEVNEYDFGLPGSGILIWHIDERVILANFEENRVNANPQRRGVDLEEADGAQDIGQVYGFLDPGVGSETGVIEDMFWGSNEINLLVNGNATEVAFTPFTTPNSLSNSGANSHIFMTNFSEPADVMTFTVREDITVLGFPQFVLGGAPFTNSPIIADLNDDNRKEIITSSTDGRLYVWNADGTKFLANSDSAIVETRARSKKLPLAIFALLNGNRTFSPALASFNTQKVVVAATDRVLAAYLPQDSDGNGRADSLFVVDNSDRYSSDPLVFELTPDTGHFKIGIGTSEGRVLGFDSQGVRTEIGNVSSEAVVGLAALPLERIAYTTEAGEIGVLSSDADFLWQQTLSAFFSKAPMVGDINSDGILEIIAIGNDGHIFAFTENGENVEGFPSVADAGSSSQLALGDIDGDNYFEIVFLAENKIFAFNHVGNLETGFPVRLTSQANQNGTAQTFSSPVLADIDDDGLPDILAGSVNNQVIALKSNTESVAGFPVSTGGAVNSTASVNDIDNDGDIEVAIGSDDGYLYVWDLPGAFAPDNIPWGGYLADAQHSSHNLERQTPPPASGRLMPANLVYNYPNPTEGNQTTIRYQLNFPATVDIRIFDLAGELVDEFQGPGFGQTQNEVNWQLSEIESGVYLARVEAAGEGMKDVAVFKIAVVK